MHRVYTTESVALAWHIRNVLETHDIKSVLKNEGLYSIAGEVPVNECMPEVWVSTRDLQRAQEIIRSIESDDEPEGPDWVCKDCGETVAASFQLCWNCQHDPAADSEGDFYA